MPISLISEVVPKNNGAFALLDDSNIRGGFRICSTLTERNNISVDKRKQGMKVYVITTDQLYSLNSDLVSWTVDSVLTQSLQAAFNGGAQIVTESGNPVVIKGFDDTSIFQVQDFNADLLFSVDGIGNVEVIKTLKSNEYTTSINCVAPTNSSDILIDSADTNYYRAIQYFYTCSNSDNSGFETGQLYLIHNGIQVALCAMIGSSIGISCGLSFNAILSGNIMKLLVNTDNSGSFSRVLQLFKIALP